MRNVEAKFRLENPARCRALALAAGCLPQGSFAQHDTFFAVANGKLKLREQDGSAWLIHYHRGDAEGVALSDYTIVPVADAAAMRAILADSIGVLAEVRKQRTLLQRGNVRLHFDHVDGLGEFGEIEAVLGPGDTPESQRPVVAELLRILEVRADGLIGVSYFEMLEPGRKR